MTSKLAQIERILNTHLPSLPKTQQPKYIPHGWKAQVMNENAETLGDSHPRWAFCFISKPFLGQNPELVISASTYVVQSQSLK